MGNSPLHYNIFIIPAYKCGITRPDPTFYEFMYGGTTGAEIIQEENQTRIVLNLTDGAAGDDDLVADGEITDVGAPGTTGNSGGGNGGCFIDLSMGK